MMSSLDLLQKNLVLILIKDRVLKLLQYDNCSCNKHSKKSFFCGFVLKNSHVSGDIGFSIKKLKSMHCCCLASNVQVVDETLIEQLQFNDSKTIVYVTLSKTLFITNVLKPILLEQNIFNQHNKSHKCVTILVHMHDGGKDVGCLRLLLVAFLLKELFLKLGSNSDIHVQNNFGIIHKLLNSAIEVIKQKLAVSDVISNLLEDHRINQEKSDVTCQPLTSYQDGSCQRVRKDQDLVYENDDNTSVIKKMSKILSEEANLVIHVTSHKNSYEVYQQNSYHGLLSNMDLEKNFEQKFCSCNVNVEGSTESIEIKDWLRKRKDAVQSIYQLKYGNAVSERIIHQVSVSSIILDIHSQNPANKLKIADCNESHQSSRTSVFILYNYARICKILQTFQEQVDKGIYPALPATVEVDFTLLKQQFEWDILLRHISMYPVLLETCFDLVCNIDETGIPGNKIYRFLEKLSFDLSSYYHHTKILLEPRSHLFNLIHARIAFITAIKSVMLDCFLLLGVDPPLVM